MSGGTLKAGRNKFVCSKLNVTRKEILKDLKVVSRLRLLEAFHRLMGHNMREWCDFHQTKEHTTSDCFTSGKQLAKLDEEGVLDDYIESTPKNRKAGSMPPSGSANGQHERPNIGHLNIIS